MVLFIVGADESRMSVRVPSKVLSLASKLFKVMISRHFREGTELSTADRYVQPRRRAELITKSSSLYEVPLPDDDPDAMAIICKLIHHKDNAPKCHQFTRSSSWQALCFCCQSQSMVLNSYSGVSCDTALMH